MIDTNNCPMCKNPVLANGYVSCQKHDIKFLHHEFLEHVKELNEMGLVVEDAING